MLELAAYWYFCVSVIEERIGVTAGRQLGPECGSLNQEFNYLY